MIKNSRFLIKKLKNVVFLGESEVFKNLLDINKKKSIISEVITSPDQSKNIKKNVNFKIFKKIDSKFKKYIKNKYKIEETLFVSMGSRWIFKKDEIENFFANNLVNFHATRLPLDTGATPFSWQILKGDRISSRLVHLVNENIDGGPIIFNEKSLFPSSCKIPKDYYDYYTKELIKFYEKFIEKILKGDSFLLKYQTDYLSRYNPRLVSDIHGWIDWSLSSLNLVRFVNAFDDPYKGSLTLINNKKVRIKKIHLHGGETPNHPYTAGIISRNDKKWIVVCTTSERHMVLIEEVLDIKGKNIVNTLKVGDRFFTPFEKLEEAKKIRAKFNPTGLKNFNDY